MTPPKSLSILLLILASCLPGCEASGPRGDGPIPWSVIGTSREGRAIEAVTLGAGSPRVLVVGGIHGNEPEHAPAIAALLDRRPPVRHRAIIRVIRDINPDGGAAGTRGNAAGVDINRNWPASNFQPSATHGPEPMSEPETAILHAQIMAFKPDLLVVLHSIASGPFVNHDGPAEKPAGAFVAAASTTDPRWHVRPSMGYATPGSLGTWAGVDRHIPTLTVEFDRGHDPRLAGVAFVDGLTAVIKAWRPDVDASAILPDL
jgi:predicted deacylase